MRDPMSFYAYQCGLTGGFCELLWGVRWKSTTWWTHMSLINMLRRADEILGEPQGESPCFRHTLITCSRIGMRKGPFILSSPNTKKNRRFQAGMEGGAKGLESVLLLGCETRERDKTERDSFLSRGRIRILSSLPFLFFSQPRPALQTFHMFSLSFPPFPPSFIRLNLSFLLLFRFEDFFLPRPPPRAQRTQTHA